MCFTCAPQVNDDGGTSLPEGTTCRVPDSYADGYCDAFNNVEACGWDGGDCCESTCGVGYDPIGECGVTTAFDCKVEAKVDGSNVSFLFSLTATSSSMSVAEGHGR